MGQMEYVGKRRAHSLQKIEFFQLLTFWNFYPFLTVFGVVVVRDHRGVVLDALILSLSKVNLQKRSKNQKIAKIEFFVTFFNLTCSSRIISSFFLPCFSSCLHRFLYLSKSALSSPSTLFIPFILFIKNFINSSIVPSPSAPNPLSLGVFFGLMSLISPKSKVSLLKLLYRIGELHT